MMSSEDEQEDKSGQRYFLVHKSTFRTKRFEKLIIDIYLANCSKRSKDQMIKREIGAPIVRSPPSLEFGSKIFDKRLLSYWQSGF